MSDAAFRVWVCSFTYCARQRPVTGFMTEAQAQGLIRKLGKTKRVIDELVRLRGWERTDGGFLIHDYEDYVDRGSQQRTAEWRARKRHGDAPPTDDGDVTSGTRVTSPRHPDDGHGGVTVTSARDPVPEPVPVPGTTGLRPYVPPQPPSGGSVTVLDGEFIAGYEEFLAELCRSTGRRFGPDAVSRARYADRRRDGFSDDDLTAAARGVAMSKFHMGLNDSSLPHNDPDSVLRSRSLQQFIGWGRGEIGVVREETAEERRAREWDELLERRGETPSRGLQA